ncbi:neutral zinc metallopeptidase [Microbispora rosea]|uniref:neutral zinc metallopeptidase n=1 Tax=Microbispora rosea TaxID=58117 RepID=UPI000691E64A|nr:neutral zinc metallopeptidase [Microbispora rosea]
MRIPLLAVLASALITGLLPGTAAGQTTGGTQARSHARTLSAPVELVRNRLYESGVLPRSACSVPRLKKNDTNSAAKHLRAWFGCLGRSWRPLLKDAKLPSAAPKVRFITDPGTDACGTDWQEVGVAQYCDKTIVIYLKDSVFKRPDPLFLLYMAAYEYGNHVQALSGIAKAADRLKGSDESAQRPERLRRYNLQAACFAGAFVGSVWKSLHRPSSDWREFLDLVRRTGDDVQGVEDRWHGKGATIVHWVNRGFTKPSPGRCNTWTAAGKSVA